MKISKKYELTCYYENKWRGKYKILYLLPTICFVKDTQFVHTENWDFPSNTQYCLYFEFLWIQADVTLIINDI